MQFGKEENQLLPSSLLRWAACRQRGSPQASSRGRFSHLPSPYNGVAQPGQCCSDCENLPLLGFIYRICFGSHFKLRLQLRHIRNGGILVSHDSVSLCNLVPAWAGRGLGAYRAQAHLLLRSGVHSASGTWSLDFSSVA